jgi:hypothetical protein
MRASAAASARVRGGERLSVTCAASSLSSGGGAGHGGRDDRPGVGLELVPARGDELGDGDAEQPRACLGRERGEIDLPAERLARQRVRHVDGRDAFVAADGRDGQLRVGRRGLGGHEGLAELDLDDAGDVRAVDLWTRVDAQRHQRVGRQEQERALRQDHSKLPKRLTARIRRPSG